MDSLDEVRDDVVRLWGRMAAFWGISPAAARVHAFLLCCEEGAVADEIQDGLELSRGGVSMACRELADWGLVLQEREAGSRRIRYAAETDLERVIKSVVETRKRREWDPILESSTTWISRLKRDRSKSARVLRERLEAIEGVVRMADSLAARFLAGGVVSKLGLRMIVSRARPRKKGGGKRGA